MTSKQPDNKPLKVVAIIAVLLLLSMCTGSDEAPQQIQIYKLI